MKFHFVLAALTIVGALLPSAAKAALVYNVDMSFLSGATFSGKVTFSDDLTQALGVDGMLYGYVSDNPSYVGSGSDSITWVWDNGRASPEISSSFLLDGSPDNYMNLISFTYNFSDASSLQFVPTDYGNAVNFGDIMISGTISAVPLPGALPLFGRAIAGMAGVASKRKTRKSI